MWRDIWRSIAGTDSSTVYDGENIKVRSDRFKGLPQSKQQSINLRIENFQRAQAAKFYGGAMDSLDDVKKRSAALVPLVINNYKTSKPLTDTVQDAIGNLPTMSGVPGQDPTTINHATPNVYISPWEAAAIYSQKGLPEAIINKKGKSPLLNRVKIKNPKLSPQQHDLITEDKIKNKFDHRLVDGLIQSLIYGGSLMFPMLKKDSPMSMHLPVEALLRYGILQKDSVDHWVVLDRWNTMHIPNWNPTHRDFLHPQHYYIPWLGAHVAGERGARIAASPLPGYWAVLMTMGWGISDIPGWIESVYNYYNVMSAIPTMINQMSILVRTLNVDSYMVTEGMDVMNNVDWDNTMKVRQASVNNPIAMDVIGDLKALQRDFSEVPALVRLIRQDIGGRAMIPEELLWSVERGAFSSGDQTEGALEKQWESIKYVHRDVAVQIRNLAMIEIINALGPSPEVLSALPYTTVEFDNPVIANAEARAKIGKLLAEASFDFTASSFPSDVVMELVQSYGDEEFTVRSDIFDELRARQIKVDDFEQKKRDLEIEKLEAEIDLLKEQTKHVGEGGMGSFGGFGGVKKSSGESGYTKLEQRKKEKTRGTAARRQGLQKAEAKKL